MPKDKKAIRIVYKGLDEIRPYAQNPRKNDKAVNAVAESIRQFGFKVPIVVDKGGEIVNGHTRYKAARKMGLEKVPCIVADDLTPEQIKALRLADNKTAEIADWNEKLLKDELSEILTIDMVQFGFKPMEDMRRDDPEIDFTAELMEEHNYLVLYFTDSVSWLQAVTLFDVQSKDALDSRKGYRRRSVGRVLDGPKALAALGLHMGGAKGD